MTKARKKILVQASAGIKTNLKYQRQNGKQKVRRQQDCNYEIYISHSISHKTCLNVVYDIISFDNETHNEYT